MIEMTSGFGETVVWRARDLSKELDTKRCEDCGAHFTGPAPIRRGPAGRTVIVCHTCQEGSAMNAIVPVTRSERAEAFADLYDVPLADLYRRYGAVLLPPVSRPSSLRINLSAEVVRGQ